MCLVILRSGVIRYARPAAAYLAVIRPGVAGHGLLVEGRAVHGAKWRGLTYIQVMNLEHPGEHVEARRDSP